MDRGQHGLAVKEGQELFNIVFKANKNGILSEEWTLDLNGPNKIKQRGEIEAFDFDLRWVDKVINKIAPEVISGVSIAPNPFQSILEIKGLNQVPTQYQLSNTTGQVLATGTVTSDGILDLGKFASGFYCLTLMQDGKIPTALKVVKID